MTRREFCKFLNDQMTEKMLSQVTLAKRLGVCRCAVSNMLKDSSDRKVRPQTVGKYCRALRVPVSAARAYAKEA